MHLKNRLDAHLASAAALAAGVALCASSQQADAAIVWSGTVNINIPSTPDGVYVNLLSGSSAVSGGSVAGWHINSYGNANLGFFSGASGGGFLSGLGSSATGVDNLAFLTEIGAGQSFVSSGLVEGTGATSMNLNSSENLIGFSFVNASTGGTHYGWMRIQFSGTSFSQPRAIVEYAYEDVAGRSILAGLTVPAPGALALLVAATLVGSRRRR
ncbi:MAG: hypothetical protein FGM37_00770 [Phycisphaerales bacterium]|nr:hypothetical protein [Phycisphaerales bacterium]